MIYRSTVINDFAFLLSSIEKTVKAYLGHGLGCNYTIYIGIKGYTVNYEPYEL